MSDTDSTSTQRWARAALVLLAFVLPVTALPTTANAQEYDSAAAEVLFREGKQLMDQKNYAAACPKLAESHRLDPATGSVLALGLCYEAEGKLASAWAAYTDAAQRAKREGQADREQFAATRARELEPKLARLVVSVESPTPGLEVVRDGVHVRPAALGTAIPIDPGEHVVEARAPGREPFREVIQATGPDELTVVVPALALAAAATPNEQPASVTTSKHDPGPTDSPEPSSDSSALSTAGIVVAAVGVVGLAVGTYYGLRAISYKNQANCSSKCEGEAYDKQQEAHQSGTTSTIAFVAGGVLAATGVTLYLVGAPDETAATAPPSGYGVLLSGRF